MIVSKILVYCCLFCGSLANFLYVKRLFVGPLYLPPPAPTVAISLQSAPESIDPQISTPSSFEPAFQLTQTPTSSSVRPCDWNKETIFSYTHRKRNCKTIRCPKAKQKTWAYDGVRCFSFYNPCALIVENCERRNQNLRRMVQKRHRECRQLKALTPMPSPLPSTNSEYD